MVRNSLPNVMYPDLACCNRLENNAKGFQEPSVCCVSMAPDAVCDVSGITFMCTEGSRSVSRAIFVITCLVGLDPCNEFRGEILINHLRFPFFCAVQSLLSASCWTKLVFLLHPFDCTVDNLESCHYHVCGFTVG